MCLVIELIWFTLIASDRNGGLVIGIFQDKTLAGCIRTKPKENP